MYQYLSHTYLRGNKYDLTTEQTANKLIIAVVSQALLSLLFPHPGLKQYNRLFSHLVQLIQCCGLQTIQNMIRDINSQR